jgi:ornithine cyclodeaminase/alanine dehydrogenase-like protein (mu-crystallin family)
MRQHGDNAGSQAENGRDDLTVRKHLISSSFPLGYPGNPGIRPVARSQQPAASDPHRVRFGPSVADPKRIRSVSSARRGGLDTYIQLTDHGEAAAMAGQILRLGADELWRLLELIDPVELMAARLVGRATGGTEARPACRLIPAPRGADAPDTEPVLLEDLRSGLRCLLPASVLYELRTAALVALAARELLGPGVVTAAVLGSGSAVQLQLAVVARHVPGVSFVAVCPAGDPDGVPVRLNVLDLLDRAGVSVLVAAGVGEAVFGANLLLIADLGDEQLRLDQLALGALLVNASGRDLPEALLRGVDGIFVDDLGLLERNRHRRFVRMHLDRPDSAPEPVRRPEGWYRAGAVSGRRRVAADLGQVLAGTHPGRALVDDILLMELLGPRDLDIALACRIQRVALEHGVGTWLFE